MVLDINAFHLVFGQSKGHESFKPVLDWLLHGRGKLVMGGSKYDEELAKMQKYLRLISLLKSSRKVVRADDNAVDQRAIEITRACPDPDFDDPHMVALLSVSGCKLFCSEDQRSYKYIKNREWYTGAIPKIYRSKSFGSAKHLLSDRHISGICMPCNVLHRTQREALAKVCPPI
ncbi:hypothetical protein ACWA6H_07050 [Pseudomonas bijieensis]